MVWFNEGLTAVYLLGHLGFTALAGRLGWSAGERYRAFPPLNYWWLLLGSMAPDLLDKPIGSLLLSNGRWLGHSLLAILLATGIVWLLAGRALDSSSPLADAGVFLFGSLMHLLLDMPGLAYQTVFFPLFGADFSWIPADSNWNSFLHGVESTYVWVTEFTGLFFLGLLAYHHHLSRHWWVLGGLAVVGYLVLYSVLYFFWVLNV